MDLTQILQSSFRCLGTRGKDKRKPQPQAPQEGKFESPTSKNSAKTRPQHIAFVALYKFSVKGTNIPGFVC
jgi:hypothetical protein